MAKSMILQVDPRANARSLCNSKARDLRFVPGGKQEDCGGLFFGSIRGSKVRIKILKIHTLLTQNSSPHGRIEARSKKRQLPTGRLNLLTNPAVD